MPELVRDGEWKLLLWGGGYRTVHLCEEGAFSWESGPQWTATTSFSFEDREVGDCMACGEKPPANMLGFKDFLEWEP
jgi:hypothetical protein